MQDQKLGAASSDTESVSFFLFESSRYEDVCVCVCVRDDGKESRRTGETGSLVLGQKEARKEVRRGAVYLLARGSKGTLVSSSSSGSRFSSLLAFGPFVCST